LNLGVAAAESSVSTSIVETLFSLLALAADARLV